MSKLPATAAAIPSANTGHSHRLTRTACSGVSTKSGAVIPIAAMRPITKPSAPITNVRRRNNPSAAIVAIRQKRSAG